MSEYMNEFPQDQKLIHLNHAGVGPWPRRTVQAIEQFAEENMIHGSSYYGRWLQEETRLRELARKLINAESGDTIALMKNTSEALSVIAYGIDWQPGDEIIIPGGEFPSNRIVWLSLEQTYGVTVREISLIGYNDPEQLLISQCSSRTRMIALSSVNYATGLRLKLEPIGQHCRSEGILFCVDAIQQLGACPFDVQSAQVDFVAADGHKWMLAPEGVALMYCRSERMDELQLRQYGWHMVSAPGEYERKDWNPARTARRFECGSPNNLGIHALRSSLELLLEVGIETVFTKILENCHLIENQLSEQGCEILSSREDGRRSGIVTFKHPQCDSEDLYNRLMDHHVLCAYRGGGVRFSPHFYHDQDKILEACELVARLVAA
jgi:selenocysteine lyase/cysteine desulfurase